MKRTASILCFVLFTFMVSAQGIYTKVTKYDKFDDIVWNKTVKTLITKNDSTIIIETKGQTPTEYRYMDNPFFAFHDGRRDSLSNLVDNVYGYETQYIVFTKSIAENLLDKANKEMEKLPDSLRTDFMLKLNITSIALKQFDKLPSITFRTISRYQYIFEYDTDYVWIKFEDGSRIIYSKE